MVEDTTPVMAVAQETEEKATEVEGTSEEASEEGSEEISIRYLR